MKVVVNLDLCQGYGNCVTAAPEFFDLDNSGQAKLLRASAETPEQQATVRSTVPICPMSAISVEE